MKKGLRSILLLSIILSLTTCLYAKQAQALTVQGKFITEYNAERVSLKTVLKEMEKKYDITFLYKSSVIENKYFVNSEALSLNLVQVFYKSLKQNNLQLKKMGSNVYIITPIEKKNDSLNVNAPAKKIIIQFHVHGTVIDAKTGEKLPGVNVYVKGTTIGVATNAEGEYSLDIPSSTDTLVYSYIGYKKKMLPVTGRHVINVSLLQIAVSGKELVVVGYGTQRRQNLTTSISTVGGGKAAEVGGSNLLNGLQGKVAGVDITQSSGRPGSSFNIKIRGVTSLNPNGNNPLYVVDGSIVDNINFLNPQDIKNISILKSAAATAIYGSRGANGVVIVTTKSGSGRAGSLSINYNGYVGIRHPVRMPHFMSGPRWVEFRQDAVIGPALLSGAPYDSTAGVGDATSLYKIAHNDYTNWPSYFLRNGAMDNQFLNISGVTANSNTNYNVGLGYQNVVGTYLGQAYKQYNINSSVRTHINKKWAGGANFNFSFQNNDLGNSHAIISAYRMNPLMAPYDSTGHLIFKPGKYGTFGYTSSVNPLMDIQNTINNERTFEGIGNAYLQFSPVSWIQLKSTFNPEVNFSRHGEYWGPNTSQQQGKLASAALIKDQRLSYIWNSQLSISRTFGKNQINFLGLYSMEYHRREGNDIYVDDLPFNSGFYNLHAASIINRVDSYFSKKTLMSYVFRINYSYNDEYLLQVTNRWDGSSVLSQGHKWGMFPTVSAGWRLTKTKLLRNINAISELKLRASYGISGNNDVNPYSTQQLASIQTMYDFGGTLAKGFAPKSVANANLTWEKSREYDFGVDYGFINERINGSVDFYNKLSSHLLLDRQLPLESGGGTVPDNIGTVRNKGIDVSLTTVNILTHDFSWTTSFTFSTNKNSIVKLYGNNQNDIGNGWFIGQPINVDFTYVFGGIWQQSQADAKAKAAAAGKPIPQWEQSLTVGQAYVKDLDGDGKITSGLYIPGVKGSGDRTIIGTPEPSWTGGFSTEVNYKGFAFSTSISTRQGVLIFSPFNQEYENLNDRGRSKLNVDFYMQPNKVTPTHIENKYPEPSNIGQYWDQYIAPYQKASYIQVNNIRLAYTLPVNLVKSLGISNLQFYFNVQNPFVFTPYTGFSPQYGSKSMFSGDNVNSSVNFQLGINLRI